MVNRQRRDSGKQEKIETEGITIRTGKKVLDALKAEAKEKQISTNILISQIFKQHLDWHSNAANAGFVPMRRGTIVKLLNDISEEEVAKIARNIGLRESKEFVLLLRNEYSLSSALDVIETWLRISGYLCKHEVRFGIHSFVLQHDMGKKWSIYLAEIYRSIFEEFGKPGAKFNLTENTVHISFEDMRR